MRKLVEKYYDIWFASKNGNTKEIPFINKVLFFVGTIFVIIWVIFHIVEDIIKNITIENV